MLPTKYIKTNWRDHIYDPVSEVVIQEGTRFTASRANNIEEGIFNLYAWIIVFALEMQRMWIEIEILGRTDKDNGTFFDAFDSDDGQKALAILKDSAVSQNAVNAGATKIQLDTIKFLKDEYVTIYDDEKQETVKISSVNGKVATVPALTNTYKKGAFVARSNSVVDKEQKKTVFGHWGTYSISLKEVI